MCLPGVLSPSLAGGGKGEGTVCRPTRGRHDNGHKGLNYMKTGARRSDLHTTVGHPRTHITLTEHAHDEKPRQKR